MNADLSKSDSETTSLAFSTTGIPTLNLRCHMRIRGRKSRCFLDVELQTEEVLRFAMYKFMLIMTQGQY